MEDGISGRRVARIRREESDAKWRDTTHYYHTLDREVDLNFPKTGSLPSAGQYYYDLGLYMSSKEMFSRYKIKLIALSLSRATFYLRTLLINIKINSLAITVEYLYEPAN